jgi:hypothetical protein
MALPSDQKLAKLRILWRRAEAARDEAEKMAAEKQKAALDLWMQFQRRANELGYCAHCELPQGECRCIELAESGFAVHFSEPVVVTWPLAQYDRGVLGS